MEHRNTDRSWEEVLKRGLGRLSGSSVIPSVNAGCHHKGLSYGSAPKCDREVMMRGWCVTGDFNKSYGP